MSNPQGIDVSSFQGPSYDWQQWAGRIGFAMAKATEGLTITDPCFRGNWAAMRELSPALCRFSYHFFHSSEDPIVQAERFVATVRSAGLLRGDNFVLDLEATEGNGTNDGVSPELVAVAARMFLRAVNDLAPGHRVLVYTDPAFAEAGNCAGLESWFLWVADYEVERPAVPAPWTEWTFWQPGDVPVDLDVYNGTEAELLAFCRMPKSR